MKNKKYFVLLCLAYSAQINAELATIIFDNQTGEPLILRFSGPITTPKDDVAALTAGKEIVIGKTNFTTDSFQFLVYKKNPNYDAQKAYEPVVGVDNLFSANLNSPYAEFYYITMWHDIKNGFTYTFTRAGNSYTMKEGDLSKQPSALVHSCSDLTDGIACINEIINASAAFNADKKNTTNQERVQTALCAYCDYRNLARNTSGTTISADIKSFQASIYDQRNWYRNKCVPQLTEHKKDCDYMKNAADKITKISEASKAAAKDKTKQPDLLNALSSYCDFRGMPKNTHNYIVIADIEAFQAFTMENRAFYRTCFQLTEHKQNCDYIKNAADKITKISEASKAFNAAKTDTGKQQDLANAMKAYREFRGIAATIPDCVVIADIEAFCAFAKQNEAWLKENCAGILGQIMAIAEKALDFGKDVGQKGLDVAQGALSAVGLGDATDAVINALPNPAIAVDFAFNAATGAINTASDIAQKTADFAKNAAGAVSNAAGAVSNAAGAVSNAVCGWFGC